MSGEGRDYTDLAPLVCLSVVALPLLWVASLLLTPFVLVWLAGRQVYIAVKDRNGALKMREEYRNRPAKWHGENMRDCCKMLGGTNNDIEAYVRMQRLYAGYYRRNALHGRDDAWWAEVLTHAQRQAG